MNFLMIYQSRILIYLVIFRYFMKLSLPAIHSIAFLSHAVLRYVQARTACRPLVCLSTHLSVLYLLR